MVSLGGEGSHKLGVQVVLLDISDDLQPGMTDVPAHRS